MIQLVLHVNEIIVEKCIRVSLHVYPFSFNLENSPKE